MSLVRLEFDRGRWIAECVLAGDLPRSRGNRTCVHCSALNIWHGDNI